MTSDRWTDVVRERLRHISGLIREQSRRKRDDELVRKIAHMLVEWEESGELYGEFARRLIAVIRPALKPEFAGWRPIDTAPRDGSWVLLYDGGDDMEPIQIRHWGRGAGADDTGFATWWSTFATYSLEYRPTHWMPLPESPSLNEEAKRIGE